MALIIKKKKLAAICLRKAGAPDSEPNSRMYAVLDMSAKEPMECILACIFGDASLVKKHYPYITHKPDMVVISVKEYINAIKAAKRLIHC